MSTGYYTFTYTVQSSATDEGLVFTASGTYQTATRLATTVSSVADADSLTDLAAILAQVNKMNFDGSSNILSAVNAIPDTADFITNVEAGLTGQGYTTTRALKLDDLDATVSSRLATSGYTAPDNADIGTILAAVQSGTYGLSALQALSTAIKAKTDNLPSDPASQSTTNTAITAATSLLATTTELNLVKAQTDKMQFDGSDNIKAISSGNVTVGGYAAGEDPATLVLDVAASLHNNANSIGAKINAAGAGGGFFTGLGTTFTLTFLDSNGNPVPNVLFSVVSAGFGVSNPSGQFSVTLPNGTYTITAAPTSGLLFPTTQIVVTSLLTNFTIVGAAPALPLPPSDPTMCVCYFDLVGAPEGIPAQLSITRLPSVIGGKFVVGVTYSVVSDSLGRITFPEVPQGCVCQVVCGAASINKTIFVPLSEYYDIG